MQIGVRKRSEDEWWVQVGPATLRLSLFQMALLEVVLAQAGAQTEAGRYDLLDGFVTLARRLIQLRDADLQRLLQATEDQDWVWLLRLLDEPAFQMRVLKNAGPLVARQLKADLSESVPIDEAAAQAAIERIMRTAFALEAQGQIEFMDEDPEYI